MNYAQSCLTLCKSMDCGPPGSSVYGIFQAKQEYWSGLPFPSPGDLPHPGIERGSPALQVDYLPSEPPGKSVSILELFVKYYLTIYGWVYFWACDYVPLSMYLFLCQYHKVLITKFYQV